MNIAAAVASHVPTRALCRAIAVAHRRFEPEMGSIVTACDPDGIAVDVGAWLGPWSHWLSRRVERVLAFEPNPAAARALRASARRNVDVHEMALSDHSGQLPLAVSGHHLGDDGRSAIASDPTQPAISVMARTLDSFELERIRLIKVDVEGHELAMLRGAVQHVRRWSPVIVVELETRYGSVTPVFGLLEDLGYLGRARVDDAWQPVDADRLAQVQERRQPVGGGYLKAVLAKGDGYANIVVFAHPRSTWVPW